MGKSLTHLFRILAISSGVLKRRRASKVA
ncbi:MAG: hypothetical protein EORIYHIE_001395, partial [Candidatus Fervidibacter sp.]